MVTERVRTLLTEPTDREIMKSHPLLSFINIGQMGRNWTNARCVYRFRMVVNLTLCFFMPRHLPITVDLQYYDNSIAAYSHWLTLV